MPGAALTLHRHRRARSARRCRPVGWGEVQWPIASLFVRLQRPLEWVSAGGSFFLRSRPPDRVSVSLR